MIRKVICLAASLLLAANSYAAIDQKEYAKCAVIEGDLARLECFDNLAKVKKLNGPQVQPTALAGKGKWQVSVDVNPIDDSKTVTLALDADSGKNRRGKAVYLVARCKSNITNLYIGWNDYLGSEANVLTRIGDNKAITQRWSLSTDKKATFHNKPIPFLKEMLVSSKLIVQVTPYNENPVTAIFNTHGLIEAIKPLRETCHWTEDQLKKKAQLKADNPQLHLEERLKQYKREFDSFFKMKIVGTSIIQTIEGSSWKPYARDDGAIERIVKSLKLAEKSSNIFPNAYFQITVHGTTHRDRVSSDGGLPFTSNELGSFTQTAIDEMGWKKNKYKLVIGSEKKPERYGKETEHRILRGKVKKTGEVVLVKILRVGQ